MPTHPFMVGECYLDRKGTYQVLSIASDSVRVQYDDGTQQDCDIAIKARIYANILLEQKQVHRLLTPGYMRFLAHLCRSGDFQAEVPGHSSGSFEQKYFLEAGSRPVAHVNGYYPISVQHQSEKWGPELRIYLPAPPVGIDLPPDVDLRQADGGLLRINNNNYWWSLVRIGFRLGRSHEKGKIQSSIADPSLQSTFASA
jgi:hypothetical protein